MSSKFIFQAKEGADSQELQYTDRLPSASQLNTLINALDWLFKPPVVNCTLSLSFLRNHYEFSMKSLWNHHYEITINWLSASPFHFEFTIFITNSQSTSRMSYEFTIYFAIKLWMYYLFCEFRKYHLSVSRNPLIFTIFCMNLLCFLRNHCEFTITFVYLPWIHYLFRKIAINSPSFSRFYYKNTICFANFLWIHYLLRNFSLNSLSFLGIHYLFREFTMNPIFPRNHYEYTIFFREINIQSLSVLLNHYEYTICFAISE